jgi:hypothetical protein
MAKENQTGGGVQGAPTTDLERLAEIILAKQSGSGYIGGTPHVPLTPEEVAQLPKKSATQIAEEYFGNLEAKGNLKDFPWDGIHVTSDGHIFFDNLQGRNACQNHLASDKNLTVVGFATPGKVPQPKQTEPVTE